MMELQKDFILGFLMPYITAVHMPLISVENKKLQKNELVEDLAIFAEEEGTKG